MTPKASPNDLLPTNQPVNPMQGFITGVTQGIQGLVGGNNQKIISPLAGSDFLNTPGLLDYARREADTSIPQSPTNGMPIAARQPQPQPTANPIQQVISQFRPKAYAQDFPEGATDYEKQAAPIFKKYDVPPAIGLGIYAMEGRGKTINPNNPYNIGAYDSNPQNANAYGFKDPIEGTEEAAKFLAGKSQYMDATKKKIFQQAIADLKKNKDQDAFLQAIAPTYSSNSKYVQTIQQTPEYNRWSYNP